MQKENKKRPFITVKEAVVSAIVIIFTAAVFEQPVPLLDLLTSPPVRNVSFNEAAEFGAKIIDINTTQIAEKFEINDGKPSLVVFHASWCIYCRKLLSNITSLKNEGKIDNIHLLVVSIDESRMKLATYLLQRDYDKAFTPYIIKPDKDLKIKDIVAKKGGDYNMVIPYSMFLDGNGKLIKEKTGRMSKDEILGYLAEAEK